MHKVRLDYRPAGPTLARFHRSEAFVRTVMGPLGSGKTTVCAVEIWRRAIAQSTDCGGVRRSRWLVVRSTYPELETTTIKSWRALFDDRFGPMSWGHPPTHRLTAQLADGTRLDAEVIFMALDEPDGAEKIRGLELTGAWFNEVREIPKAIVDMATGRVGRYPARRDGGADWFGVIADSNAFTSDEEKAQAQAVLAKIAQQPHILQAEINKIEAGHRSIFVAGWRPFIGWVCGAALFYHFIGYPLLDWAFALWASSMNTPTLVGTESLFELVLAMLGLAGYRTWEKLRGQAK